MIKSKLDFKLINIALIAVICYFVYQSRALLFNIMDKVLSIVLPLFLGFAIAYAFYPVLQKLEKYKIPKVFGIFLVLFLVLLIFIIIIFLLVPLSEQVVSLINNLIVFVTNITTKFEGGFLNKVIGELGLYVSDGFFKTINLSINIVSNAIITISFSIYFLLDMEKIRFNFKKYLQSKSDKLYSYFKVLDLELQKYISGFFKIVVISFFEYTILYYIIGHPNALLLGMLSSLSNFIPYFGGMIVQVVSVVSGLVIEPSLGLRMAVLTLIFGFFDSYILNPLIYGKSNQLHPVIVILSVFAGGILFGVIGVLTSIPVAIIIINSFKFYKEEYK